MNPEAPVTKTKGFSAIVESSWEDKCWSHADVYDDLKYLNTQLQIGWDKMRCVLLSSIDINMSVDHQDRGIYVPQSLNAMFTQHEWPRYYEFFRLNMLPRLCFLVQNEELKQYFG